MDNKPPTYKVWSYKQMGRTFVIDESLPGDNNVLKAVCEVKLPVTPPKDPSESPFDYKYRLCELMEVFAKQIVSALAFVRDYDEGNFG